jgi:hypothetical protein
MLQLVTAVISALLNNVSTVLLLVPVTLAMTEELEVPTFPFLFGEIFASNVGGTATLIGDPPNMLIGSSAGLDFNAFLGNLAPVIVVVLAAQLVAVHLIWGRRLHASPECRAMFMGMNARGMITDPVLLRADRRRPWSGSGPELFYAACRAISGCQPLFDCRRRREYPSALSSRLASRSSLLRILSASFTLMCSR